MPKKKTTEVSAEVKEAVLLLRYHKRKPSKADTAFMSYAAIAQQLDLPYWRVRYICRRADVQKKRKPKLRAASRLIEAE